MATNLNADLYALARLDIFFPGQPAGLTGQCNSLCKWFIGEMCDITDWQTARGNAKDFGDTLVRQGLAYTVPESQRKRGDLAIWKEDGGGFGHDGVLLSGDRVFEENVGLQGTPSQRVKQDDGSYLTVYASRIDPLYASWRKGPATFYRLKSYVENVQKGPEVAIIQNADNWRSRVNRTAMAFWGRPFTEEEFQSVVGKDTLTLIEVLGDNPETNNQIYRAQVGRTAISDKWDQQIYGLQSTVADLTKRPTQAQLDALTLKVGELSTSAKTAQVEAEKAIKDEVAAKAETKRLQDQADADAEAGLSFWRRLGQALTKLLPGGK